MSNPDEEFAADVAAIGRRLGEQMRARVDDAIMAAITGDKDEPTPATDPTESPPPRHKARVLVGLESMLGIFRSIIDATPIYANLPASLPKDVEIVAAQFDFGHQCFDVLLSSVEFEPSLPGQLIPVLGNEPPRDVHPSTIRGQRFAFEVEPIGIETDGTVKPVADLSYEPSQPSRVDEPKPETWRDRPPLL